MEVVVGKVPPSASIPETCAEIVSPAEGEAGGRGADGEKPAARKVRRRALVAVLEQCRRALELLDDTGLHECGGSNAGLVEEEEEEEEQQQHPSLGSSSSALDSEVEELHDLLKSKVESPKFLEKLGSIHMSVSQKVSDESTTWDVVTARDLWDDEHSDSGNGSDEDDDNYVLVKQEDIVDGIACFMAAYLLSLKETKELTPNQLQEALSKTFSIKKKKGKLRKAWDGGKVIYNVASWSATAIGGILIQGFFHAAIKARRMVNSIRKCKNEQGELLEDISQVKSHTLLYFQKLLNQDRIITPPSLVEITNTLTAEDQQFLSGGFSDEDIKLVVMNSPKMKKPGPDGFSAEFFQACWTIIGQDLCTAVQHFFTTAYTRIQRCLGLPLLPSGPLAMPYRSYCDMFFASFLYT